MCVMGKKKKRTKRYDSSKAAQAARREQELADYGRILSLRPSVTHESSKDYKRAREKEIARREMSSDDFFFILLPKSSKQRSGGNIGTRIKGGEFRKSEI